MNEPQAHGRLTSALRVVAADDEQLNASAAVQARLLAEVRLMKRARRRRARTIALAAAAAVLAAIALPRWLASVHGPDSTSPGVSEAGGTSAGETFTDFFPLMYSNVPAADGHMVRIQVPRAALASFGVTSFDDGRSSTVLADVVVGDDGLARAVRFVRAAGKQ